MDKALLDSSAAPADTGLKESFSKLKTFGSIVLRSGVLGLACLGAVSLVSKQGNLATWPVESNLRGIGGATSMVAAANKDTVGGPGAPLAKQVVVGMDTNINLHAAWNDWEAWFAEMRPYWTEDMIYDFNYVGEWGFGPSHGLRAWYQDEHLHFNKALPDCQFTDFIRAANHVNCTSASYGLARWQEPFAGVPPPSDKPWVRVHDLDFYLLEGDKIKRNWCIIDVLDLFLQVGYNVVPEPPMPHEGYKAPEAMDGFPAPLSAAIAPGESAASEKIWRKALAQDYLGSAGASNEWLATMKWYGPGGVGTALSRANYSTHFVEPLQRAFSNRTMQIDSLVCEGVYCGAHFYVHGTHTGKWLGEEATGRRVPLRCGAHARIKNGKIVEGWLIIDVPNAFQAMGVDLYARAKGFAYRQLAVQAGNQ